MDLSKNGSRARQIVAETPTKAVPSLSSTSSQNLCILCSQVVTSASVWDTILNITRTTMFQTLCNHLKLVGIQFGEILPKKLCTSCESMIRQFNDYQNEMERLKEKMEKIIVDMQDCVATDQILRPKQVSSSDIFFEIRNALWEGYKQRLRDQEAKELAQSSPQLGLEIQENRDVLQSQTDDSEDEVEEILLNEGADVIEENVERIQKEREVIEILGEDEENTTADISAALVVQAMEAGEVEQPQIIPRDDYQSGIELGNEIEFKMQQDENDQESWEVGADVFDQYLDSNSVPIIVNPDISQEGGEQFVGAFTSAEILKGNQEDQAVPAPNQIRVQVPNRVETRSVEQFEHELVMRREDNEYEEDTTINQNNSNIEVLLIKPRTGVNARHPNYLLPPVLGAPLLQLSSDSEHVPFSTVGALNQHEKTDRLQTGTPRPSLITKNFRMNKLTPKTEVKKRAATPAKLNDGKQKKRGPGRPPKKQYWRKTVKITTPKTQVHQCEICSRTFPRRNYLNSHLKTHAIKGVNPASTLKSRETPKFGVKMLRSKAVQIRRNREEKEKQVQEPGSAAEFFQYLGLVPKNGN